MLETLLKEIYPPDCLVNLAIKTVGHRAKGRSIPDLKWSYVRGTDASIDRFFVLCGCMSSRGMPFDDSSSPSMYIETNRPLVMTRHFHISQKIYFVGICHYCDTVYWSSPEIRKLGEGTE